MASVIRLKPLSIQVCVPIGWKDEEIVAFANRECLCGAMNGWQIRRSETQERVRCAKDDRMEHVVLDA